MICLNISGLPEGLLACSYLYGNVIFDVSCPKEYVKVFKLFPNLKVFTTVDLLVPEKLEEYDEIVSIPVFSSYCNPLQYFEKRFGKYDQLYKLPTPENDGKIRVAFEEYRDNSKTLKNLLQLKLRNSSEFDFIELSVEYKWKYFENLMRAKLVISDDLTTAVFCAVCGVNCLFVGDVPYLKDLGVETLKLRNPINADKVWDSAKSLI